MQPGQLTIPAFYINGGIREIIPIYPLYAIMFGEHGVTPFELSLLFAAWAGIGLLMEVPSGVLADRFSRKWLIVISGVLKSLAFVTWFMTQNFLGYLTGFLMWGLASTLRSGAWEALLHDVLSTLRKQHLFTHHYGRIKALASLGVVSGELLGALLITQGYNAVLLVSAAMPLLATLPFILFVDDVTRSHQRPQSYGTILRQGVLETVHNRTIRYIVLVTGLLLTILGVFDEFVPPVLYEQGFSLSTVAMLAAPIYIAQAAAQAIAGRFRGMGTQRVVSLMVTGAAFLAVIPLLEGWLVVLTLAVFFFLFELAATLYAGLLQHEIRGDSRATVTSVVSLGDSIGAMLWFLVFGAVADITSMSVAGGIFGLMAVFLALGFSRLAYAWGIVMTQRNR